MSYPLRTIAAVTALGLASGGTAWALLSHDGSPSTKQGLAGQRTVSLGRTEAIALTTAHDCPTLLKHYKIEADRMVGPYGLNGPAYPLAASGVDSAVRGPIVPGAKSAQSDQGVGSAQSAGSAQEGQGTASVPDSTTNVQVSGVDESDVMKTSGDLMVSAVNGVVQITRLAGKQTKTLATWRPAVGSAESVLLDGTNAVIIGDSGGWAGGRGVMAPRGKVALPSGPVGNAGTDLTILDLADPSNPRPVRRLHLDGSRSGEARLVDGELRLAITSGPSGLTWKQPTYLNGAMSQAQIRRAEKRATAANRKLIAKSTTANWIPEATVTALNAAGKSAGPAVRRPLLDCAQVAIPGSFSGLQTLSMVSVDLRSESPLASWKAAGVIAAGGTLYATADHAWLATSQWNSPVASAAEPTLKFAPSATTTQIHLFDTPARVAPKYVASGEVSGSLLSQFAMDERGGQLRVATTTEGAPQPENLEGSASVAPDESANATPDASVSSAPSKPKAMPIKLSEGRISVLTPDGDRLSQIGLLTGLGQGEQIRGVRFDGDVGYVVTYRQTDPLFTVDLSDPRHPQLRGELKLPGYSAYLHPAGAGRVLGLGQDGTEAGQVTGLQLSLFDVTDLAAPRRLDRQRLAGAWSDVEADHHAFTMAGNLVLIPYSSWTSLPSTGSPFRQRFDAGVIAVRVNADTVGDPTILRPIGNAPVTVDEGSASSQRKYQRVIEATPLRTAVHDNTIYTLTPDGVAAHGTATFTRQTFAAF